MAEHVTRFFGEIGIIQRSFFKSPFGVGKADKHRVKTILMLKRESDIVTIGLPRGFEKAAPFMISFTPIALCWALNPKGPRPFFVNYTRP